MCRAQARSAGETNRLIERPKQEVFRFTLERQKGLSPVEKNYETGDD